MDNSTIFQIILIVWSVLTLCVSFVSFSWNRMILTIEFWWCTFLAMLIILGFFKGLFRWCDKLPLILVLIILGAILLLILTLFYLCKTVSMLVNRNQELAMQVALLNRDSEEIMNKLGMTKIQADYISSNHLVPKDKMKKENENEEKHLIRN